MPNINFHPECDIPRYIEAASEYTKIWKEDGDMITEVIERVSGFKFRADLYNAIILEKFSHSLPLTLRASYPTEQKKSTLVHELLHKVLVRTEKMQTSELENHKILDLILYDIWTELYGEDFAKKSMDAEKLFNDIYSEAWIFAMNLSKDERRIQYNNFLNLVNQLTQQAKQ